MASATAGHRQELHGPPRRGFDWGRFLLVECAVFHLLCAVALLVTGRPWWAIVFLAAGMATVGLMRRLTALTQLLTWYAVFPLGLTWGTALAVGITDGRSALAVIAWPFLYLPWAVVAVRLALGKR